MRRMIPLLIISIFAAAIITLAVFWGFEAIEYAGYEREYEVIADEAIAYSPVDMERASASSTLFGQKTLSEIPANSGNPAEQERKTEVSEASSANEVQTIGTIDFSKLLAQNADTVGWLCIPNTKVNYPVVQTDNNETYLNLSFQRKKAACGTLFLDYQNTANDQNLIIYGHNMGSSGSLMFSSLLKYKKAAYAKEHPAFQYRTPESSGEYRIVAVCNLDIRTLESFNFLTQDFATDSSFSAYVDALRSHSIYPIEASIGAASHLITLVTCDRSRYGEYGRVIVVGMLERMLKTRMFIGLMLINTRWEWYDGSHGKGKKRDDFPERKYYIVYQQGHLPPAYAGWAYGHGVAR